MNQIEKNKVKAKSYNYFTLIVLIIIALLFLFPFYWIITGSFKTQPNKIPPEWFPKTWTIMHWQKLFKQPAWTWFFNSVFMSIMSMILVLGASSMAGYVLAKKAFTGRKIIFSILVMAMALPKQVILVPLVRMMNALSLYNTLWAVILGTVGWPFGTFLMKQFSEGIPTELLEAAKIDGSGEVKTFTQIVCPMLKPAFGALAIFTFINTWNDYFLQLVMLTSRNNLSISLGIATLQAELSTDYGLIMAGATLGAVPIVTIFIMFQKYFTNGIALGAVKG
ncbi:carbohydrate ABC transporter permease [Bullifex porci]|uniref:carbohydrate ABC transporter permease n=1 Tax=Bullifex porci TaxID=2606638 RepID=UPI0023F14322|nr:carbohydrate ABC transporter permease [Bullifex porci]MDD7256267.1 carbohydrate ABC transporter permease [Bullifex porci]MDY2741903.1 carbohydrate ABC transporter permease [Bullifex porci]